LGTVVPIDKGVTLCIFAKPPRPGQVKTRLAASVGTVRAAALASAFLADSWAVPWGRKIIATPEPDFDFGLGAERWDQGSGDLGARIARILGRAAPGIAIGADSPGFPLAALCDAAAAVGRGEAALGRARDGGFWLLGLPRCPEGLLADLPWSTDGTAEATELRLEARGFRVHRVDPWFDIDDADDLAHFRRRVPVGHAPQTWSALGGQG